MAQFKVAVVVGSNRRDSINRKLAQALGKLAPADVAFQVAQIDDHIFEYLIGDRQNKAAFLGQWYK